MEFLIFAILVYGAYSIFFRSSADTRDGSQSRPSNDFSGSQPNKREELYRPKSSKSSAKRIVFDTPSSRRVEEPSNDALAGLHDAFTGAPLNRALGLFKCATCKVYYHAASVSVINEENARKCVACGSSSIVAVSSTAQSNEGRDYNPDVINLQNFRQHFDRVITFECRVQAVKVSRRGQDYAVMFEAKSWNQGLKLVFFRGSVTKVGGANYINSLTGRTVRVRGLLINHPIFGPEIIVSERGMILGVS